jgi:RHS repeat-associated protein
MLIGSLSGNSEGYRYGFNGKEKDDQGEWGMTHYDYGFRIYNPGLARFLSVDPLTKSYPMLTPYQFASNTPIWAIDLDGLEAFIVHGTNHGNEVWDKPEVRKVTDAIVKNLTNNTHSDYSFNWVCHGDTRLNHLTNNEEHRNIAAWKLVDHIMDYRATEGITDEEITLIGYSHGGIVSQQAAGIMYDKYGIKVNIISINTPAENDDNHSENPAFNNGVNDMIDIRSKGDPVTGGLSKADRYVDRPKNFEIQKLKEIKPSKDGGFEPHYMENVQGSEIENSGAKRLNPVSDNVKNP